MPRHIGGVAVGLPVDVRGHHDECHGKKPDESGKSPTAIGFGGNISIDVVGHGGEYSPPGTGTETSEFGKKLAEPQPFIPNPLSQVLSGPYLDAPAV